MPGVSYRVRDQFFDRAWVKAAVKHAGKGALSRCGAITRLKARDLLAKKSNRRGRPKKNQSEESRPRANPGQPPLRHQGGLRDGVVYAYSFGTESVLVGPLAYNVDGGRVPSLLEFGGRITRRFKVLPSGLVVRMRGRRLREGQRMIYVTHHYHAFPYMAPALKLTAPRFPALWAHTVK